MAEDEHKIINGRVFPMEDYGTIRPSGPDDRVNILQEDELVSTEYSVYFFIFNY